MPGRPWSRDETLVAFALYCKIPFGRLHARNPEIIAAAKQINRTASAVAMKCVNLASLDESHVRRGVTGLSNVSTLDRQVWMEFVADPDAISFAAATALERAESRPPATAELIDVPLVQGREEERTVRVRVNQRFFRDLILASYSARCAVCGLGLRQLVVASHIVPWATDPAHRMNPRNGLCLCGTHDLAYERGVLLVTRDCELRVATGFDSFRGTEAADDWLFRYEGRHIARPERWPPDPELLAKRHDMAAPR